MFVTIKKIKKPLGKQDFYLRNGEVVPVDWTYTTYSTFYRQFKYLTISDLKKLVERKELIFKERTELKVELQKRFREGDRMRSKTFHLASILDSNLSNQEKLREFWNKITDKLETFKLTDAERKRIFEKIETQIPKM